VDVDEVIERLTGGSRGERLRHRERRSGREATIADCDRHPRVERALAARGIDGLYRHQVAAVEAIRAGRNVVLATPTASGKSLAYTVPAFERALSGERALYLAPQRALVNDQHESLSRFADDLGFGPRVEVDRYTGSMSDAEKRAVRDREPQIVLCTPDMLHYALLPWAGKLWEWLFSTLSTVVVDEVHEYRGVFGSQVALLLRRFARICERHGSAPEYVCCSATIGNPREHAAAVTGQPETSFSSVEDDASATGPRHWLFWNPPPKGDRADAGGDGAADSRTEDRSVDASDENEGGATGGRRRSPHVEAAKLFCELVAGGHQTLVFTGSRQGAERYAEMSAERLRGRGEPELASGVAAYQAALPDDRREAIEEGLNEGRVRGVWSTSALELGIDVGGLDAVILDGYPGTRMSARQRAGRAGRGTDPALVVLVGGNDALDQYLMENPAAFFDEPPERAVVNPRNRDLLPDHVRCAAEEAWLAPDDDERFGAPFREAVADLTEAGDLDRRRTRDGLRWLYDGGGSPQQATSLRSIDDREIRLVDRRREDVVARLGLSDALRDAHPGAVYHHQGRTYEVVDLDVDRGRALLDRVTVDYHTRALREKSVDVLRDRDARTVADGLEVRFADVRIRETVTGYLRVRGDRETRHGFEQSLPETEIRTEALYFTIPPAVTEAVLARADDAEGFPGAIHAVEHGMISLFPLELLCDRRDVGGLSTPRHPHTGAPTVFVHGGYPGGVGLARGGYEAAGDLLRRTRRTIRSCDCVAGCPSCVQSPHCGNANSPLAKGLAVALLDGVFDGPAAVAAADGD